MSGNNKVTAVDAIKMLAISSLVPMMDKFPLLEQTIKASKSDKPAEEWDFFIVSACVGLVLMTDESYKGEHEAIENRLNDLDKNYLRAVNDLSKFFGNAPDDLDVQIATIGHWVLWNVKKDNPTDDEIKTLAFPIGQYIMNTVHSIRQEKIGQEQD